MTHILLAIIYISFISLGLPDSLLGSAWPILYKDLQVPVSYAGILSMIIAAGTIVSSLFSSRLIWHLGTGKITAISVAMTALDYVIGDTIRIDNFTGEVIELSLKSTKVKGANGEIYIFANHLVDSVVNLSQARAGVKIEVPTAYEENSEKIETILKNIVEKVKKLPDVYQDSEYLGIEKFDVSAVNYALMIYCKSSEQYAIKRKVLKMIKEIYDRENVKIPYNQIEVHNGKEII